MKLLMHGMKKLIGWLAVGSLLVFLVQWLVTCVSFNPLYLRNIQKYSETAPNSAETAKESDGLIYNLFQRDFLSEYECFKVWTHMKDVLKYSQRLSSALEAIKEARIALDSLILSNDVMNSSIHPQCPYSINTGRAATKHDETEYILKIPCGLVLGSSITIARIPNGVLSNFQIDLIGKSEIKEQVLPIFHYYAHLHGNRSKSNDSVSVEYSWTVGQDESVRQECPSSSITNNEKADNTTCEMKPVNASSSTMNPFPFKHGYTTAMTVRMDEEEIKLTVDGADIASFPKLESLNPWLETEVKISGDFKLIYFHANGLPESNVSRDVPNEETKKEVELFIGIFSLADNFQRRMAIRHSWMQYPAVRSGAVAVRFFVGLHKNQVVNEAIWKEANTYGDIQLMPWVDNYNLITLKTAAICIFGSQLISVKYIMKTDDDAFVRIDEMLASLNKANATSGMLYGLVNSFGFPDRNPLSKWGVTLQEWPSKSYPPYAQGPGYVISKDIAAGVYRMHTEGTLKMFKLEDVGMGIWIEEMKKQGMEIHYIRDTKIIALGCEKEYIVAHYQSTRQLLCLWEKLQKYKQAECCNTNRPSSIH